MHYLAAKRIFLASMTGVLILLAGCAREPSDADIQGVVEKALAANPIMKGMMTVETKKVGCHKEDNGEGFLCDVQVKSTLKMGDREMANEAVQKIRMVKTDDGWMSGSN